MEAGLEYPIPEGKVKITKFRWDRQRWGCICNSEGVNRSLTGVILSNPFSNLHQFSEAVFAVIR